MIIRWTIQHLVGFISLVSLVISPIPLAAQMRYQEPEDQFKWVRLKFTEIGVGVEAEGERESRKMVGASTALERGYTYVAPVIILGLQGSVYHPNLLQFDLNARDGVSWQEQSLNQPVGANNAGAETKIRFLQRYHGNVDLFKEKPFASSLFADKDRNFRQYDFFSRADVDQQRYGGRVGYTEGPVPVTVNVTRQQEDVSSLTRSSTLDETTLSLDMRNERKRNSYTSLSYMMDQYDRQEEGVALIKGTYHTLNLNDTEIWGNNDRYRLNSSLLYNRLDDAPVPTQNLMVGERAGVEHTPRLQSNYDYTYDYRTAGLSRNQDHSGQATVRHQLYDSLSSALDVHGFVFDSSSPGASLTGVRYGAGLSESYTKRLWSGAKLSLGYSGRLDREERNTTGQTLLIVGEPHTLTDGITTYLNQPRVTLPIRVTDITGKEYRQFVDYVLFGVGELMEIRRAPGSTIPDGSTILVDYQASIQTSAEYVTFANQFYIRLDLFNNLLGVYGRLNLVDNQGESSLLLNNVSEKVAGTDLSWRWFRAGAEYQVYDSTLAPLRSTRLFESFNFEPSQDSTLGIDLDQSWTHFVESNRRRVSYNFITRYNTRLTSHLAWNVEGGVRVERGEGFDQTLGVVRTGLEYTRGKLALKMGYDYQDQDFLGEQRLRHYFFLQAKRTF